MSILHILILLYAASAFLALMLLSIGIQEDLARLHWKYGHFPWVTLGWWLLLIVASMFWPAVLLLAYTDKEAN